jgi:hypothetical protein
MGHGVFIPGQEKEVAHLSRGLSLHVSFFHLGFKVKIVPSLTLK